MARLAESFRAARRNECLRGAVRTTWRGSVGPSAHFVMPFSRLNRSRHLPFAETYAAARQIAIKRGYR